MVQLDEETLIKGLRRKALRRLFTESKRLVEIRRAYSNRAEEASEKLLPGYTYYIFRKSDKQLRNGVDKALQTLRSNGTLSKYRSEWFDHDYSDILPDLEP